MKWFTNISISLTERILKSNSSLNTFCLEGVFPIKVTKRLSLKQTREPDQAIKLSSYQQYQAPLLEKKRSHLTAVHCTMVFGRYNQHCT